MNIRRIRSIGLWLVVCCVVSLLSVQVFAETAEPEPTEQTMEVAATEAAEEITAEPDEEPTAPPAEPTVSMEEEPSETLPALGAMYEVVVKEQEPNSSKEKANAISSGVTVQGVLTAGYTQGSYEYWILPDVDYFTFTLQSRAKVMLAGTCSGANFGASVWNEAGEVVGMGVPLGQGSNGEYAFVVLDNANSSTALTALDAGTYYIYLHDSLMKYNQYKLYLEYEECKHTRVTSTTQEPTCSEVGYLVYTCQDCHYSWREKNAEPLAHTEVVAVPAVAPTCEETGLTERIDCSVCGKVLSAQKQVPALGHTEAIDAAVDPACITEGLTEGRHCSVCNKVLVSQTIIPALGHTEIADPDVLPTCMGTGLKGIRCGTCGEVLQEAEVIPALGHTEVVAVPAVAPTCEKPGRTERIACSVCAEVLSPQKVVPALGHTVVADAYRAPTCSGTGLTKGSHCSVCGKVLQMQKSIPMVAHTEEIVPAVKPTCTTTGLTAGKRCSVCKAVLEQQTTVAVLEHRKVIDSPGVEATCTENGSTEGSHCSVCKTVIQKAQTIPAHHNYANGVCVSCGITSSRTWVWKYDEAAKTLFIFGTGAIPDYGGFDNEAPWYSLAVENVIIDEGITRIGNSAFLRNYRLSSVTLPASLTSIGNTAFHECYALSSITLPDSITSIGTHAFNLCTALTDITLPEKLTILEDGVFCRCSKLRTVTLPEGLTDIELIAFCDCTSLAEITLPSSVKKIDTSAFSGCSNLRKIIMEGSAPEIYEAFSGVTATVYYPANDPSWDTVIGRQWGGNLTWEKPEAASDGCGENLTWQYNGYTKMLTISGTGDMWNFTESNIPWKDYQRNIKTVMIADGVTGIGEYAFAACGNLCSITVPGSVTSIGDWAFTGCSALKEIIFLGDAPAIDGQAFHKVTATVIYPEGNAGWTAGVKQNYGGILTWGKNPKGDTNADGSVSGQDAVVLLWNVLFPEQYPMDGDVDYNRDAIIDAEDAVYLLWHTLFPELYPLD